MASGPLTDTDRAAPVFLVKAGDPVLVGDAVVRLVDQLVGDEDRSLMVEELDASRWDTDGGDRTVAPLVDAAQTPPFLTDRRIVVGRQLGAFTKADDVGPLLEYLADPLDTTALVLVWEAHPNTHLKSGAPPKKVLDAVKKAGGLVLDTSAGARAPQRAEWLDDQLAQADLRLTPAARKHLLAWAGEEPGKITGVLATLAGSAGAGAKLDVADVEPALGVEGDTTPWALTDALDAGDVDTALAALQRMLAAGRHPLAIMATLQAHYGRMLALDGSDVTGEKQAAERLGIPPNKSSYQAKKALDVGRRLGSARVHEFIGLLAKADLDLRGAKAWPGDLVMDVLVARLASRSRR